MHTLIIPGMPSAWRGSQCIRSCVAVQGLPVQAGHTAMAQTAGKPAVFVHLQHMPCQATLWFSWIVHLHQLLVHPDVQDAQLQPAIVHACRDRGVWLAWLNVRMPAEQFLQHQSSQKSRRAMKQLLYLFDLIIPETDTVRTIAVDVTISNGCQGWKACNALCTSQSLSNQGRGTV